MSEKISLSRKGFEEFESSQGYKSHHFLKDENDFYPIKAIDDEWHSWLASETQFKPIYQIAGCTVSGRIFWQDCDREVYNENISSVHQVRVIYIKGEFNYGG
jgi:hypothetical protein